jgi:predicted outer membrane lipoprotein
MFALNKIVLNAMYLEHSGSREHREEIKRGETITLEEAFSG